MARAVNEELLDAVIRHAHFVERLKAHESNEAIAQLNALLVASLRSFLTERLEAARFRGHDPSPASTRRLEAIRSFVRDRVSMAVSEVWAREKDALLDIAKAEVGWTGRAIVATLPGFGDTAGELVVRFDDSGHSRAAKVIDVQRPTTSALRHVLTQRQAQGATLYRWWQALGRQTILNVDRQIRAGLVEGDSTTQIVRRVIGTRAEQFRNGVLHTTRTQVNALVRTSVNHVSAQAREEMYRENATLVKSVRWVSTLDSRTTVTCMALDGRVFGIQDGPRPPAHHQCRSTTVPVIRSIAELVPGSSLHRVPVGTRASFNGQVPADLTYPEFLRRQSRAFQDAALGKGRAEVFRRGELSIDRFVDDRGRPLSLRDLLALEMRLAS